MIRAHSSSGKPPTPVPKAGNASEEQPSSSARARQARVVRRTTRSCLVLADELGSRSLALPAFGTGVGGFPLDECAGIMVDEARAFEPSSLERVIFAVFGEQARTAFESELGRS